AGWRSAISTSTRNFVADRLLSSTSTIPQYRFGRL
ncbi:MAG: hypothetical protein ACI9TI_000832, partial [Natronomonas sp.]